MCGFVGFIGGNWPSPEPAATALAERMIGRLAHRGPDHKAVWLDGDSRVALAHARLAIVDLSPNGNQPMDSPSGRYVIVFNGEIYNHQDVRDRLSSEGAGVNWRSRSDTETLLAAIDRWGVEKALQLSLGMFGLALWDRAERVLYLARDRLGEKPVYYGWQGEGADRAFLFGSELKALAAHPAFRGEIDRQALSEFARHAYVPAPLSIYRGIFKLDPGCYLRLESASSEPTVRAYWSAAEVIAESVANPVDLGPEQAIDELERVLSLAVRQQMMSDVPLGAFLSGGVDSSTVVALMQAQSSRPVKSFSIGFHEEEYDEAKHAKAVASHLGTDHTELYLTPQDAIDVIPSLPDMYDEPFADSSQIPTFLVSKLARSEVTVSLSGDGGDELFGGYNRYALTKSLWGKVGRIPRPVRAGLAKGMAAVSPRAWDRAAAFAKPLLPARAQMRMPGDKIHKAAAVIGSASVSELYRRLISQWQSPETLVIGGGRTKTLRDREASLPRLGDIERMMALDLLTYLPDDILVKVDRAAMAVSLETRVPLLDARVVEFAWRLPLSLKIRNGDTKWALRQLLYRHVPKALIERPKMGFGVPVGDWLRGPLRDWAEDLLSPSRLGQQGYFDPEPIRSAWEAHLRGDVNEQYRLWTILMFQAWVEGQGRMASDGRVETAGVAWVS